ncbi:MAG: glycosyltransferase family 39 protein [Acidobacteriota bacterium]|nr:glycosyltransferase family 39 protein [Acidobacteriota bacterium]
MMPGMAQQRTYRLSTALAILGGLLLRLWFVEHRPEFAGDAMIYGTIARNLVVHGVYGFNQQVSAAGAVTILPTFIRLPGYPLLLALCFRLFGVENYMAVLYVQIAADLLTCVLAMKVAGRLFGRRAAMVVLWLAALCPFTANYVATPLTETFVLTAATLALYALLRWQEAGAGYNRWLWAVAAALSASLLLRPEQGLLAAAVLPAVFWMSRGACSAGRGGILQSAGPACAAGLCVAVALLPWTLRNWRTFHTFQPLAPRSAADPGEPTPAGFNRWYRTWAIDFASTDQVYWNVNGAPIAPDTLPDRAFDLGCAADRHTPREKLPLYGPTVALLDSYNQTTTDSAALDAQFAALARRRIHAAPLCYAVALPLARLVNMLVRPRTELLPIPDEWWHAPTRPSVRAFAVCYAALDTVYVVMGLAGLVCALRLYRQEGPEKTVLLSIAATLALRAALLLTLDNSEPRYTLEFFPLLTVCAGAMAVRSFRQTGSEFGESKLLPRR